MNNIQLVLVNFLSSIPGIANLKAGSQALAVVGGGEGGRRRKRCPVGLPLMINSNKDHWSIGVYK